MKLVTSAKLALNILLHSKLRSWLTVLGIVIGVAAVVAILSLGEALQANVASQLSGAGQDILTITSGSGRATGGFGGQTQSSVTNIQQLSEKDVQALKLVPGIKAMTGTVSGRADVYFLGESTKLSIQGRDPSVFNEFNTKKIISGRLLTNGDVKSVVIDQGVAEDIYKKDLLVGSIISINDKPFRIIGILGKDSTFGGGNSIYMSNKDAREILTDLELNSDEYSSIQVKVENVDYADDVIAKIDTTLLNTHHVRDNAKDFSIFSPSDLQERFQQVTSSLTLFLGAIAAVSLIVGAIGVANTMFTSVLERTKEIGIMKSIGAKNRDILTIFIINAALVGLVGGVIGIFLGGVLSYFMPTLLGGLNLGRISITQTLLSFKILGSAVGVAILIGVTSGAIPAYQASRLKPVDALRYE